ncbi:MAG: hypothetical protein LBM21_01120, partial [Coriobacteriales bacterium]|nr:hypothetical protein [Coriobacteriales bacterium]
KLYAHDAAAVSRAIEYALRLKARVVEHDEKEAGERECLNYGHTLAHALETASGFTMPHGRAVADGMRFASRLSGMAAGQTSDMAGGAVRAVQAGRVTCASQAGQAADFINEQDALLDKLGLAFASRDANYGVDGLYEHMLGDKKARGGVPRFVLVDKPGTWHVAPMERDVVTQALRGFYQQS